MTSGMSGINCPVTERDIQGQQNSYHGRLSMSKSKKTLKEYRREAYLQGRKELTKEIEMALPSDIDLRKGIKEWTFSKNRDYAEGQQNMLDQVRMAIESVKEEYESIF